MEGDSPGRKVVLVVEDDDAIRKIQRVMLEGAGYSVLEAAQRLLGSGAKTCLVARPQIFRQAASAGPLDAGGVPLFFTRESALRHMAGCVKRTALFAGRFRNDHLMILLSRLRRGREVHIQHIADLPAARTWLQGGTPWLVALEYASGIADVAEVLAAAGLGGREALVLLVSRTPLAESELGDFRGRFPSLRLAWVSDEASEEGVREALRGLRDGA